MIKHPSDGSAASASNTGRKYKASLKGTLPNLGIAGLSLQEKGPGGSYKLLRVPEDPPWHVLSNASGGSYSALLAGSLGSTQASTAHGPPSLLLSSGSASTTLNGLSGSGSLSTLGLGGLASPQHSLQRPSTSSGAGSFSAAKHSWLPKEEAREGLRVGVNALSPTQVTAEEEAREAMLGSLRSGHILAPSRGSENDASRVRNGGARMGLPMLRNAASDPNLRVAGVSADAMPAKTPRTLRGVVRKASEVNLNIPAHLLMTSPSTGQVTSAWSRPSTASGLPSHTVSPQASSSKRVKFDDEVEAIPPAPRAQAHDVEGVKKAALKCRALLMDDLYKLRRLKPGALRRSASQPTPEPSPEATANKASADEPAAGDAVAGDGEAAAAPAAGAAPEAVAGLEEAGSVDDQPLLHSTLGDTEDEEAELLETESLLAEAHVPVDTHGGNRHATALLSNRTLAVVRRKVQLLKTVEARLAGFEKEYVRCECLIEDLMVKERDTPPELIGVKKFLSSQIHNEPGYPAKRGKPGEADKSCFMIFVATFGLPSDHKTILALREMHNEACEWFAQRMLKEAQMGADSEALKRMIKMVIDVCGDDQHPAIAEVRIILGIRLAEKVLVHAEKVKARDENTVANSKEPQPESARSAADSILEEMQRAVALEAPPKHPCMEKAKGIENVLRREVKDRCAQKVLLQAKTLQEKDAAAAAKVEIMEVGPAAIMADTIERELLRVMAKEKISETDPCVVEAKAIAKSMRDEDGNRKRLMARAKRLAQQAEAAKAAGAG